MNFARKIVFELRISYEKCSEISPEIFEALFCGSEKFRKSPAKFPTKFPKFPCEKSKKITDELLQERRENIVSFHTKIGIKGSLPHENAEI